MPLVPARTTTRLTRLAAIVAATALTAGCSLMGGSAEPDRSSGSGDGSSAGGTVVLVTHDSWFLPKRVIRAFEEESGY
ncbi:MAG: hypothetical protein KDB63_12415, partial [Nocardioidaceae bacterium]|nr:hypothetical protein [Nocardioidaceae bacterium]